ncbi:MAG: DUF2461 domain-containing protein [Paludibacteraceae bacterium]|nr:DUF2461 domain-containing protein [Paludibacteraceae bacterium]
MKEILQFLTELSANNNREWFAENKARYQECYAQFVAFSAEYIRRLSELDSSLAVLQPKDCIWRIYRDVRFSHDKRPYKEWFGCFPAAGVPGQPRTWGKHSMRGGYYVHIQPGECMFAGGIWDPSKELLTALRKEIEANYEEVEDIMGSESWKRYFGQDFDPFWGVLKKVPAGFDPEFKHADWLKHKCYTFSTPLTDKEVCSPDFIDKIIDIAAAGKPMNDFLNYTFEEYGEFPSRC